MRLLVLALLATWGLPGWALAQTLTRAPELLTFVEAPYPASELEEPRSVTVGLRILIAVDGTVSEVEVIESGGEAFDAAAVEAARQFVFSPAEVDGAPSAIRIAYRYTFEVAEEAVAIETADLVGVVRARRGAAPLEGIALRASRQRAEGEAPSERDVLEVITDAAGRFELLAIAPGLWSIALSGEAIVPALTEETIAAGERLEVAYDVSLAVAEDPAEEGDDLEIVVTAPALRRSVVSTEVSAEEARLVPGTSGDVVRVIESMPGVARSTAGSGALVVWGASPDDTRVYVDGVPIPRLFHEGGLRSVVQPDFVTSVELIPGGYGPAYGRGLGGIVSIRTETPAGDGAHGVLSLDVLDASAMVRGEVDGRVRLAASGRVSVLDLLADAALGPDISAFVPVPRYRDGQLRGRIDLGGGDVLELVGMLASDRFSRGVANPDPALATSDTRSTDFQRVYLTWTRDRGDGTEITVTPYFGLDQRLSETRTGNVGTSLSTQTLLAGLRARVRTRVSAWLSLEVGLDAEVSASDLPRSGSIGLPPREGDVRVFGQPPPDAVSRDAWTALNIGVAPYVEGDFTLADGTLHVLPGVRLDPYLRTVSRRVPVAPDAAEIGLFLQDFRAEPRLSVRWDVVPELSLRAAGGLYHQPPRAEDLSASFGTPDLPISQGLHAVLGATVRPTESTSIEVTGFFTYGDDLAMRSAASAPLAAQALVPSGESRAYGAQVLLRQNLLEGFQGWIAYTLSRSERLDRSDAAWRLSDYDQTHVLTTVLSYRIPTLELDVGLRFRVTSGYPRTQVIGTSYDASRDRYQPVFGSHNGIRLPEFVQLDLRVGRTFRIDTVTLDVFLEVLNVWDQPNVEELVYSPDYSARAGVRGLSILPVLGIRGAL